VEHDFFENLHQLILEANKVEISSLKETVSRYMVSIKGL